MTQLFRSSIHRPELEAHQQASGHKPEVSRTAGLRLQECSQSKFLQWHVCTDGVFWKGVGPVFKIDRRRGKRDAAAEAEKGANP